MTLYVIEIAGQPILAFPEENLETAEKEANGGDISEALQEFQIGGKPVWDGVAPLFVREAHPEEETQFEEGFKDAITAGDVDEDERDEFAVFLVDADEAE